MKLSILNYHILYTNQLPLLIAKDEVIYANEVQDFRQQMAYFYNSDCQVIILCDFVGIEKSTDSIIITFDDGHVSSYTHAMPILQEYAFPAVFFVTVEKIDSPNYLSWQQLREMSDNGMSIQSHTMTHPFLSDLPPDRIKWELQESKNILEQELGKPVDYLSLPGGRYSPIIKEIAKEVGYKAVCTSIVGYNYPDTDPYSLRRWTITRNMSFSTFRSIVENRKSTLVYYKSRQFLLNGMKKMMGNKLYAAMHREITGGNG